MNYLIVGAKNSDKSILAHKIAGPNCIAIKSIEELTEKLMFGEQNIIIEEPEELADLFNPDLHKQIVIESDKLMGKPLPDIVITTTTCEYGDLVHKDAKLIYDSNVKLIFI